MPDRTCNHCGKRLTFFLKLSGDGRFCSPAHRKLYQEEMERLALESLSRSELVTRQRMAEPNPPAPPAEPQPPAGVAETPAAPVPPLGDILTCHPTSHPPAAERRRALGIMIRIGTMVPESVPRERSSQWLVPCGLVPLAITLPNVPAAAHSIDCTGPSLGIAIVYPTLRRTGSSVSLGIAAEVKLSIQPVQPGKAKLTPRGWRNRRLLTTRFPSGTPAPSPGGMSGIAGPVRVPVPAALSSPSVALDAGSASLPIRSALPAGSTTARSGGLPEAACLPIPVGPRTGQSLVTMRRPLPVDWPYAPAVPGTVPDYCFVDRFAPYSPLQPAPPVTVRLANPAPLNTGHTGACRRMPHLPTSNRVDLAWGSSVPVRVLPGMPPALDISRSAAAAAPVHCFVLLPTSRTQRTIPLPAVPEAGSAVRLEKPHTLHPAANRELRVAPLAGFSEAALAVSLPQQLSTSPRTWGLLASPYTLSLRVPSTQDSPTQPPRQAAPSETNPRPVLSGNRPALRGTALTQACAIRIPLHPRPLLWDFRLTAAGPFASELALATGQHQPASPRRVLPGSAPRLPVSIPLESPGERPQALVGPSPADCLDLASTTPAGAFLDASPSVPLPRAVGEPVPLSLSCAAWDGPESALQIRRNEPNGGGLFIPQIRTNTLRPSILFLPGPPGATPATEAPGRPPVISIADLRGSAGPVKERARSGAR